MGNITISVGAFLALLIMLVNCRGARRAKNKVNQTFHARTKVRPDLKGHKPSVVLRKSPFGSNDGANTRAMAPSSSSHKKVKPDWGPTSIRSPDVKSHENRL